MTCLVLTYSDTGLSLITVSQLTEAIIHGSIYCAYYVFDSHLRDAFGNPSAVLVRFKTLDEESYFYLQKAYVNRLLNIDTNA